MRAKYIAIGVVLGVLLSSLVVVLAGDLDAPAGPADPASQMYTLQQIYDRLATGAAATKMTAFTEPASGPNSTMHTLDEIMVSLKTVCMGVPKTGQKKCWGDSGSSPIDCTGTGQDGEYQFGVLPVLKPDEGVYTVPSRFTDNGDGTVSDNLTGLIWLQNANCWGEQKWVDALAKSNALGDPECGLSDGSSAWDWRLPNAHELHSLIDATRTKPALPCDHPFVGVESRYYWSSTTVEGLLHAYVVGLDLGDMGLVGKSSPYHVWPVRGGQ